MTGILVYNDISLKCIIDMFEMVTNIDGLNIMVQNLTIDGCSHY